MSEFYDREGRPLDLESWAQLLDWRDPEAREQYRRVARTQVGDSWVSTVWIGLNHSFGDGPPLIFETLVMGGRMDGEMDRYSTLAQAWEGHAVMVGRVRAIQGEPVTVTHDAPHPDDKDIHP